MEVKIPQLPAAGKAFCGIASASIKSRNFKKILMQYFSLTNQGKTITYM
jgi:hypothetical protein